MDRLTNYKAQLKAAKAEEIIRCKEYSQARRALGRICKEVINLQNKVESYERVKLAQAERHPKPTE